MEWLRATEIPELNDDEGKLAVFFEKVEPNDIKQGSVSNCYFLSALSVLAEREKRIKNMIVTKEINEQGIWSVRMFKNGLRTEVVMDNYIPCLDKKPCFTRANGNELWVIMLEKAWAKATGTYLQAFRQSHLASGIRAITGAPVFSYSTDDITDEAALT